MNGRLRCIRRMILSAQFLFERNQVSMIQGYPLFNMFLYNILLISGALLKTVAHGDRQPDCSTSYSTVTLITKTDIKLKGHQREILPFASFPQCSLRCVQEDWCISINFEAIETKGVCELNDYGVESDFYVSEDKSEFEVRKGIVYSQLRPSQVLSLIHI